MNARTEKLIPPLRSSFDFLTLLKMRSAVNAFLTGRISGTEGQIHYADGSVVWDIKPTTYQTILPFTFYNVANAQNTIDSWRTFQMRDGIVAARSKTYQALDFNGNVAEGNFEQWLVAAGDGALANPFAQPFVQTGFGQVILAADGTQTQISGIDETTGEAVHFGQILLDTSMGATGAAFWLEIIDDPVVGFAANLWGGMFGGSGISPTPNDIFPDPTDSVNDGLLIIPLAQIYTITGTTFGVEQFQTGHLINRYPSGSITYRGPFVTKQIYWPNELVTYGGHSFLHVGFAPEIANPVAGASWIQIS